MQPRNEFFMDSLLQSLLCYSLRFRRCLFGRCRQEGISSDGLGKRVSLFPLLSGCGLLRRVGNHCVVYQEDSRFDFHSLQFRVWIEGHRRFPLEVLCRVIRPGSRLLVLSLDAWRGAEGENTSHSHCADDLFDGFHGSSAFICWFVVPVLPSRISTSPLKTEGA